GGRSRGRATRPGPARSGTRPGRGRGGGRGEAGPRADLDPGSVLRRDAVLGVDGADQQAAGPGLLECRAPPRMDAARPARCSSLPGPRRGGIHQRPPAPHDRRGGEGGAHRARGGRPRHGGDSPRRCPRLRLAPRSGLDPGSGLRTGEPGRQRPGGGDLRAGHRGGSAGPAAAGAGPGGRRLRSRADRGPSGPAGGRDRGQAAADCGGSPVSGGRASEAPPRIGLVTYSTKPRGGVIHCLELAEALHHLGCPVHVFALGEPGAGFFRLTTVPHTVFPAPPPEETLEDRVWSSLAALQQGLDRTASEGFDILHAQDCIAGRAVVALRDAGAPVLTVRTVHHVDDFTTEALVECQRRSILDPDRVLVVSQYWRRRLADEFGIRAEVVTNGVNPQRCRRPRGLDSAALRARVGATGRTLFLT